MVPNVAPIISVFLFVCVYITCANNPANLQPASKLFWRAWLAKYTTDKKNAHIIHSIVKHVFFAVFVCIWARGERAKN